MHWTTCDLNSPRFSPPKPPQKMFLSEHMIYRGLRLSLGHFGQQVPESPMSQLQNSVSTSSLPPFIVDLLTIKVYPRSKSCKPPFQKVFFSHTVVPESLFWKLSIRKTFFANSRSRKLSLQTVVSHTTPVLKINNHAPGGWRTKDILGGPKSLETKKLGSSKG